MFGAVTAGAYQVKVNQNGWVDPEGDQEVIKTATVSAGTLTTVDFVYDLAATLTVNVQSLYGGPPAVLNTDDSYGVIAAHTGILTGFRQSDERDSDHAPHAHPAVPVRGPLQDLQRPLHGPGPDRASRRTTSTSTPRRRRRSTPGQVATITILEPPVNLNATFTADGRAPRPSTRTRATARAPTPAGTTWAPSRAASATRRGLPFGTYDICVQFTRQSNGSDLPAHDHGHREHATSTAATRPGTRSR